MNYTPNDILNFVIENNLTTDFILANQKLTNNYSISEIVDARFTKVSGIVRLHSESYKLNIEINDEEICAAVLAGIYVSAFISRFNDTYNLHFLTHNCKISEKSSHEDLILDNVLKYMILQTILRLRLDTPKKVEDYIKEKTGNTHDA